MKILKPLFLATLTLATTACVSLDSVVMAAFDNYQGTSDKPFSKFICDNNYKTLISYQSDSHVVVSFKDGKNTFVIDAYQPTNSQERLYIAKTNTVKWHEHGDGTATLTYPDSNWRDTKKVWQTSCRPR